MDIQYLLWLQNFRLSINDALTPFMESLSIFGATYIFLLPAFVYWCINKRSGLYVLSSTSISILLNPVIKLTACVYRPWIRDPRIIPAGNAIATAGGYSFPSGHTMTATPIYGGLALLSKKAGHIWLSVVWVVLILLLMFSRNYLGVHTPQDIVVGLLVSLLVMWFTAKLFRYLDAHPEKENMFLLLGFVIGIASLLYVWYKPYPMDYVDGKLLVDPAKMKYSGSADIASILGLTLGRYIEKRFIRFKPSLSGIRSIILCVIGLAVLCVIITVLKGYFIGLWGKFMGRIAVGFVQMLYIMAVWPAVMKLFCRKE